jgi:FkbM family methyltransferase
MQINEMGIAVPTDDHHHPVWIKANGKLAHDEWLLPKIRPYLKRHAVDVGAHIGTHAIFYAEHSELVSCFEPHPVAFACLEHNLRKWRNVNLYNVALSDHRGTISMIDCPGNLGASRTVEGDEIECVTLDMVFGDDEDLDFIKIDAEGDEIGILLGATKTIERYRPVMLIELNEYALGSRGLTGSDLIQCIESLGYSTQQLGGDAGGKQYDLLCFPSRKSVFF